MNLSHSVPSSIMVWTINDVVIENPQQLEEQFHDIRSKEFEGVAVFVRCSRYTWDDVESHKTLKRIGELCKQHGLQYWIGPDPRFISRSIVGESTGLMVAVFGDQPNATHLPHFAPIENGRFSVRCIVTPRPVHTLNEVAIEYHPLKLIRVYAVRLAQNDKSLSERFFEKDIYDITDQAHFFYNAHDHYVESFGSFNPPDNDEWVACTFFLFRTNHFDYSDKRHVDKYIRRLELLHTEGIHPDGVMWDEAGYTCRFGTLPFSSDIQKRFQNECGYTLKKNLWKFALDAADGSHISLRNDYYRIVQTTLNEAQALTNKAIHRLWGRKTIIGIHDTWRFESADMCDMNHGSLDLWCAMKTKSGGFVDLGSINLLGDSFSEFYKNLATMNVIGASLGRHSRGQFSFNNLWTMDEDEESRRQYTVMDHCVNTMALFSTRWLAHCYGPAGTIGEEDSFLGLPFTPGYPHHRTWKGMVEWNRRLRQHFEIIENQLPVANVLLIYPVETMYALADQRANHAAEKIFQLILTLVDAHYQIDVVSSDIFTKGSWNEKRFRCDGYEYDAVIYPYPQVVSSRILNKLREGFEKVLYCFGNPQMTTKNIAVKNFPARTVESIDEVLLWFEQHSELKIVDAPDSSWVSITKVSNGNVVTLAPSRYDLSYRDNIYFNGKTISINECRGLMRILYPIKGEPYMLDKY